ncbi:MAG: ATP-dependent zinc metalloprotease FtsH [Paludibacteraceae bacterium]|nr:ATP-dependent zinc metalloprotease FtsH [Paludibacteraceae bacterium]MBP6284534.1 ATP-dependent zinc metalloprotease FtsH [Paludibacteraceae bacterium]
MENENKQEKKPTNNNNKPKGKFVVNMYWFYGIIAASLIALNLFMSTDASKEVSYSEFKQYAEQGYVESIIVITNNNEAEVIIKKDSAILKTVFGDQVGKTNTLIVTIPSPEKMEEFVAENDKNLESQTDLKYEERKNYFDTLLWSFGPFILIIVIWVFIMRRMSGGGGGGGGNVFNVGKSKAQLFDKGANTMTITFKDVAGLAEAKEEIQEIVDFLKNPIKYTNLGGKIPKGALLVGPPGTGKTLLAKAVAGEAHVPFFSMSGSDFVEMFVGVGASRVRDLFRQAKEKAPCIIFIDEIDAIGRARGKNPSFNSNDERENTLNQLLTEMDGFGSNSGVIILAATNRAEILDKALLRAGRFDRQIHVDLPDVHERNEIFGVHLRPLKLAPELNIEFLAKQTPGFSGADIANVCNEAALIAARKNKTEVEKQDFLDAVDRIIGGMEKKSRITTIAEKASIATHEAGHASVSWLLEYANPLVKVTIVPRGKALGAAWYLPEERQLTTKEQILDEMCAILGGRAAEDIVFNRISTGALNDLERATKMAYAIVVYYGMSEKLSNVSYFDSASSDYSFTKPYSEKTAEIIDREVQSIIAEQYERAKKIIADNKDKHANLSQLLIEKEVIFSEDMENIFGKRPWASRMDELISESDKKTAETSPIEVPEAL